jgi:hypothetical protein
MGMSARRRLPRRNNEMAGAEADRLTKVLSSRALFLAPGDET